MSNYLNQLVAKSFNLTDTVQPLLFSIFEPIPESAGMVGVADSNWEQQTVNGENNQLETEWDTWISTISAIEEPWEGQLSPTMHSGRSLETQIPEDLSYQRSPDLTPATATDFVEVQSTDLTPSSVINSEELLNLASQKPVQVNSEQSASETLSQRVFIEPATEQVLSSADRQKLTPAVEVETNFSRSTPLGEQKAQPATELEKLIESPRVVSRDTSQEAYTHSHIIPPLDVETLQITSRQRDEHRQQLGNLALPLNTIISPITQNIQSALTLPLTRAIALGAAPCRSIATETIVPLVSGAVVSQLQSKSESSKLIESPRLVSITLSQQVHSPNSYIVHPPQDVVSSLGKATLQITSRQRDEHRQQLAHPLSLQNAHISPITQNIQSTYLTQPLTSANTVTDVSPVVPHQQSKSESSKLIESPRLVSITPSQQVHSPNSYIVHPPQDVVSSLDEETLQITSRQRDEHRQQLVHPLLPQNALISTITQNIQSTYLTQPLTSANTVTNVSLANSNIEPLHLPTSESSKNGLIEINPIASFSQDPKVVSSNSRRLSPLREDVENLHVTSKKVLPTEDRHALTSGNVQQTNFLLARPLIETQQKQNNESFKNQPIKIHRVASSSQLQEKEKLNLEIIPPFAQNVKMLHVTSLQDGDITSQLSLNQPQLLSGEILPPTKRLLSTPDNQPLTPANAWETNVPLATPAAVPRQQAPTKFLENSPVQINISPETNTALSNSVPEAQPQSAPELSGIQQYVVNRVVSSPQLPIVTPLPQQSNLETGDVPRRSLPESIHTVSTFNTLKRKQRDFSQELKGFEQIVPRETIGLADSQAEAVTGMIQPLTTAPVVQPMENFASSDQPNLRMLESSTTQEQLSPSQYTKIVQQSLEKIIHWKDVAAQGSDSAVETTPQRLEHLMGSHLQEKFLNLATPPNIKVSIGRVEIRATQQTKPARQKPRPMPFSVMSLDEYLSRRARGGWR